MIVEPLEVLRQRMEVAYRTWQEAWNDHGYNSAQERAAFERIKQLGLRLAEATAVDDTQELRRALVRYGEGIQRDLDERLDRIEQDLDRVRELSADVTGRLQELEQRH